MTCWSYASQDLCPFLKLTKLAMNRGLAIDSIMIWTTIHHILSTADTAQCVCVCVRRGLTSLCTPPVSQHTLIGSDLGMTHHMPTPHTQSDLPLPLPSFPSVLPFMHLRSSPRNHPPTHPPTHTHPLSRCSFVPFHSHFSSGLHIFTRFASCCLPLSKRVETWLWRQSFGWTVVFFLDTHKPTEKETKVSERQIQLIWEDNRERQILLHSLSEIWPATCMLLHTHFC